MIVEPFAHDALEQNINPVGRLYYSASTLVCVPTSLNQEVGTALGAQAGEGKLREVAASGGFRRFRRATESRGTEATVESPGPAIRRAPSIGSRIAASVEAMFHSKTAPLRFQGARGRKQPYI